MKRQILSQEWLKLIACICMLLDHIGAVFVPWLPLRIIGRLSFPIYCFLLSEGAFFTHDPKKYASRLALGALISELPFDLLFFGSITPRQHSVMVTLLLGYLSLYFLQKCRNYLSSVLIVIPFALIAELVGADYGGLGVVLIHLFGVVRNMPHKHVLQFMGIFFVSMELSSSMIFVGTFGIPVQLFAVLSIVPIFLYSGKKATKSKIVQECFYLFYPIHLIVLLMISKLA